MNSIKPKHFKLMVSFGPKFIPFLPNPFQVCGDKYPKDGPIIWINMRQEPIVYINGNPVCARPPNKIGEYAELGNVTSE